MASFLSTRLKKSCTKVRDFLLFTAYLFTLTSNGRIFWEVIGKKEEVRSAVAFRGGEKHFYIEKHRKMCYNKIRKAVSTCQR